MPRTSVPHPIWSKLTMMIRATKEDDDSMHFLLILHCGQAVGTVRVNDARGQVRPPDCHSRREADVGPAGATGGA